MTSHSPMVKLLLDSGFEQDVVNTFTSNKIQWDDLYTFTRGDLDHVFSEFSFRVRKQLWNFVVSVQRKDSLQTTGQMFKDAVVNLSYIDVDCTDETRQPASASESQVSASESQVSASESQVSASESFLGDKTVTTDQLETDTPVLHPSGKDNVLEVEGNSRNEISTESLSGSELHKLHNIRLPAHIETILTRIDLAGEDIEYDTLKSVVRSTATVLQITLNRVPKKAERDYACTVLMLQHPSLGKKKMFTDLVRKRVNNSLRVYKRNLTDKENNAGEAKRQKTKKSNPESTPSLGKTSQSSDSVNDTSDSVNNTSNCVNNTSNCVNNTSDSINNNVSPLAGDLLEPDMSCSSSCPPSNPQSVSGYQEYTLIPVATLSEQQQITLPDQQHLFGSYYSPPKSLSNSLHVLSPQSGPSANQDWNPACQIQRPLNLPYITGPQGTDGSSLPTLCNSESLLNPPEMMLRSPTQASSLSSERCFSSPPSTPVCAAECLLNSPNVVSSRSSSSVTERQSPVHQTSPPNMLSATDQQSVSEYHQYTQSLVSMQSEQQQSILSEHQQIFSPNYSSPKLPQIPSPQSSQITHQESSASCKTQQFNLNSQPCLVSPPATPVHSANSQPKSPPGPQSTLTACQVPSPTRQTSEAVKLPQSSSRQENSPQEVPESNPIDLAASEMKLFETLKKHLQDKKSKLSKLSLSKLMASTFSYRMKMYESFPPSRRCHDVLEILPIYQKANGEELINDMGRIIGQDVSGFADKLCQRWSELVQYINQFCAKNKKQMYKDESLNALCALSSYLENKKNGRTQMIEILTSNSGPEKVTKDQPFIMVNIQDQVVTQAWIMVDSKPFLQFNNADLNFKYVVFSLLAAHFVLNFSYAKGVDNAYRFLEYQLLNYGKEPKFSKYKSFITDTGIVNDQN